MGTATAAEPDKKNLVQAIIGFLMGHLPFGKKDEDGADKSDSVSVGDRLAGWWDTIWSWVTMPFVWIAGLFKRDEKTTKSAAAKVNSAGVSLVERISAFFVGLTRSRVVFWGGFILVSGITILAAGYKGIFFARIGTNVQFMYEPGLGFIIDFGEFAMFGLGYLFALPMDTIPGKGKFLEFIGDVLVASTFFFLFRAASALIMAGDIFMRNQGGVSGDLHLRIVDYLGKAELSAIWWIGAMAVIFAVLKLKSWREKRSSTSD